MRRPIQILIIDDTDSNRYYLSHILNKEGFETLTAEDGLSGRKIAAEERPDLIVLDLKMPGESGLITCRRLKEDPKTFSIPVIFISADDSKESVIEGLKCGSVDYITKPFDDEEVIARIRIHIQMNVMQNELIAKYTQDLKSISDAQKSILIDPGDIPEAQFSIYHKPLREAGGDYYDVVKLSSEHYLYVCADVAGHDIGSIVTSSALKTAIRQYASIIYTPHQIISQINLLLNKVIDDDLFVTLICAFVNRKTGMTTIINAGHPYPVILYKNGFSQIIKRRGLMLGCLENPHIEAVEVGLSKGDRLFMFTDGLLDEILSPKGYDHIVRDLEKTRGSSIAEQIRYLSEESGADRKHDDDILIMGVSI